MTEFLTYSKFYTKEDAEEFAEPLSKAGIKFKIEHERNVLDKIYIGESLDPLFLVKISQDCFDAANKILLTETESQLNNVDKEYYLFDFTNEELIEVINHPNEWNQFDQALANKILLDRKIEIPKNFVQETKPDFQPAHLETSWLVAEYALSILLGFMGIIIGVITITAYRTLPDGKKIKMYDAFTVRHATFMLVIGIARTLMQLLF